LSHKLLKYYTIQYFNLPQQQFVIFHIQNSLNNCPWSL